MTVQHVQQPVRKSPEEEENRHCLHATAEVVVSKAVNPDCKAKEFDSVAPPTRAGDLVIAANVPRQLGRKDCLSVRWAALVISPSETVILRL